MGEYQTRPDLDPGAVVAAILAATAVTVCVLLIEVNGPERKLEPIGGLEYEEVFGVLDLPGEREA